MRYPALALNPITYSSGTLHAEGVNPTQLYWTPRAGHNNMVMLAMSFVCVELMLARTRTQPRKLAPHDPTPSACPETDLDHLELSESLENQCLTQPQP